MFWFFAVALLIASQSTAQTHDHHSAHRMTLDEQGMVMNHNPDMLPRDCVSISKEYEFKVSAGSKYANEHPGLIFGYNQHEFQVEPCSLVHVSLTSDDEVRHQWMVHGLPRYLYPGGMFHLEAAGGATVRGSFIVPSDDQTYLVHCDITQHMEKGMKGQLKVGNGSGDLWAIPGVSSDYLRASYLPARSWTWSWVILMLIPAALLLILSRRH